VWYLTGVSPRGRARASSGPSAERVAARLEPWFEVNARELPWRETRDLYSIWVSEVMLQQTRVDTVLAYYEPFLARFPTLEALAEAQQDEVLEAWSGLGYYRRARFLHRGARFVRDELGGILPTGAEALRAIPGVGPYTAGALASIGQDRAEPLVDGNVARVSSRLRAVAEPKAQDAKHREHWEFTARVLESGRPRVLAQALMELGATVCKPKNPTCESCPLSSECLAHARGLEGEIPAPKIRKRSPELHYWALAILHKDRLHLLKRPSDGLLADMWCLPLVERREKSRGLTKPAKLKLAQSWRLEATVFDAFSAVPTQVVKHVFSHRVWHLHLATVTLARKLPKGIAGSWSTIVAGERPAGGVPSVTQRLLEGLDY
jgi:A/G-specific adenine glycosylase